MKKGKVFSKKRKLRERRENSLDIDITDVKPEDVKDFGRNLYFGNETKFRG